MKKVNDISFGGCYENLGDISDLDHSFATKFTILNIEDFTMYASLQNWEERKYKGKYKL